MQASVLGVGVATLDIVNTVAGYPPEDAEVRATSQRRSRGGNTANTLAVLAQLGHACDWAGTLADEPDAALVIEDLAHHGVGTRHVRWQAGGKLPTSYVTLSAATGSRTIVHYRDLPEYPAEAFTTLPLADYGWVHFEGRAVPALEAMLRHLGSRACSLEVEKPRPGIERLFGMAGLLLCSRQYALDRGHPTAADLLRALPAEVRHACCAWGEAGAWGRDADGTIFHCPAYPPSQVVDTLGAGDVFNAGVIDGWLQGLSWRVCVDAGCRLAGRKCGRTGFDGLAADAVR